MLKNLLWLQKHMEKATIMFIGQGKIQKFKAKINLFYKTSAVSVEPADLVTFTEEILNGKLHFLCSGQIFHDPNFDPLTLDLFVMMHTLGKSFDKNILILEQPYLYTVGDWFWYL